MVNLRLAKSKRCRYQLTGDRDLKAIVDCAKRVVARTSFADKPFIDSA